MKVYSYTLLGYYVPAQGGGWDERVLGESIYQKFTPHKFFKTRSGVQGYLAGRQFPKELKPEIVEIEVR